MKSDATKATAKINSEDKRNEGKWSRKSLLNWTSTEESFFSCSLTLCFLIGNRNNRI